MKRYTDFFMKLVGLFAIVILSGCGGGGGEGPAAGAQPVVTQSPGIAVAGVSSALSAFASTDTQKPGSSAGDTSITDIQKMRNGIQGFKSFIQKQSTSREKILSAPKTTDCSGGGTRTDDFDGSENGSVVSVKCVEGDETFNSTILIEILGSQDCSGTPFPSEIRFTIDGTISSGTGVVTFSNLVMILKLSCIDFTVEENLTNNITLESGSLSFSDSVSPKDDVSVTFFVLTIVDTISATEDSFTIDGKLSVKLVCADTVTLTLATTDPVITPTGGSCPVKGTIVSSGDVNVTVTFNPDGSVDAGGEHFAKCEDLDIVCS